MSVPEHSLSTLNSKVLWRKKNECIYDTFDL